MPNTVERIAELRLVLMRRRREVQGDVQGRMRVGRTDRTPRLGDEADHSDADMQSHVDLALLQMKTETLARVDEALVRLGQGKYGACVECAQEISGRRLYALPFAVRCQPCEDRREREQLQRIAAERRGGLSRVAGVTGG
jgi:RNA polymerase-binding transcription factor DksA